MSWGDSSASQPDELTHAAKPLLSVVALTNGCCRLQSKEGLLDKEGEERWSTFVVYIARSPLHLVPGARPGGLLLLADGQGVLAAVLHAAAAVSCLQKVCIWAAGRQALPARLLQRPSWCYSRLLLP